MRRSKIAAPAAALAALALAAGVAPASAGDVTVALNNPGGTRTVYVENLLGQALTTIDFGTSRAQPFRVRVVDETMDRNGFKILATMSSLYKSTGPSSYDFGTSIASDRVSVGYPSTAVNALDVDAIVAPVYNVAADVTGTLCTTLTTLSSAIAGATPCTVRLSGLTGVRQTLDQVVNLADLGGLPLVPQSGDSGAFTNPAYAGVAANAPKPSNAPDATNIRLLSGNVGSVLTGLQGALDSLVAKASSATTLVPLGDVTASLRTSLTGPVWDALSATEQSALVGQLKATARTLLPADVVAQTGTYLSFPNLSVAVPNSAAPGDYRGTLVVTAVQT